MFSYKCVIVLHGLPRLSVYFLLNSSIPQDKRRVLAVAIDSMLISGPALHALYGVMEFFIPTSKGGWLPATCHILLDTFLLDPMFVASFFCVTGVLESRSFVSDVLPGLRR